jgi:hypothetical protein
MAVLFARTNRERMGMAGLAWRAKSNMPRACWRVLIAVPPAGWGGQLAVMRAWLDDHFGPSGWASAPAGRIGVVNDAVAFYFADPLAAGAFVERFSCGYRAVPRRTL